MNWLILIDRYLPEVVVGNIIYVRHLAENSYQKIIMLNTKKKRG